MVVVMLLQQRPLLPLLLWGQPTRRETRDGRRGVSIRRVLAAKQGQAGRGSALLAEPRTASSRGRGGFSLRRGEGGEMREEGRPAVGEERWEG